MNATSMQKMLSTGLGDKLERRIAISCVSPCASSAHFQTAPRRLQHCACVYSLSLLIFSLLICSFAGNGPFIELRQGGGVRSRSQLYFLLHTTSKFFLRSVFNFIVVCVSSALCCSVVIWPRCVTELAMCVRVCQVTLYSYLCVPQFNDSAPLRALSKRTTFLLGVRLRRVHCAWYERWWARAAVGYWRTLPGTPFARALVCPRALSVCFACVCSVCVLLCEVGF